MPIEIADVERREGRIALQSSLAAKVCLIGLVLGARQADETNTHGFGVFNASTLLMLTLLLLGFGLQVAGLVYGFGGRRTATGRWAILLSSLSLLAGLAFLLILRQQPE